MIADIFKKSSNLEKDLQRKILKYLNKRFPYGYFRKISDKSISHIPDIIGCIEGRFIAIEVKRKGEEPRAGQKAELLLLESSKAYVNWFDDYDKFKVWIHKIEKEVIS